MTTAMFFFATITLTATQLPSTRGVMVGARFPGVILVAASRFDRSMLYTQRTYCCAATMLSADDPCQGTEAPTDDTLNSRSNQLNEFRVGGVTGFDENCSARHDRLNCLQASHSHRLARFLPSLALALSPGLHSTHQPNPRFHQHHPTRMRLRHCR
jgi:hypothetical protein